ncbi:MAG: RimK family alpha-L-glutamate ligase [Deltaproteobacteria bacterium]|jgi:ribosomal protein S6--L-glutamate ligase|nr:RimK family alpha-L-glutamate ligase [Deltaproteobacteria bacterium]MBW2536051.1 RimK family alpha-L-glutamate ligase [Deltaproteobacteria bacterium]
MRLAVLSRNPTLYSTCRLVIAARARGHRVDVIDPLAVQLVVAPGKPRLSLGGRRLPRFDAVIPRIGASITAYATGVLRQLEARGAAVLNGADPIALARDQARALDLLARRRVAVPRTVCTRSLDGLDAALRTVGGCPVVVKLPHGTQGVGTMLADTPRALQALTETLWAMGQQIVLQEYLKECRGTDIRAIVVGGQLVTAMRRRAPRGEFRANLHRGGAGEAVRLDRRTRSAAVRAARWLGLDVAGVDLLNARRGPLVLEVNSSPGLEGVERTTEVDVAGAIIDLAVQRATRRGRRRKKKP